jgi:flagellar basal-body rod modification protein FlgD
MTLAPLSANSAAPAATPSTTAAATPAVDKNMFLQLLVTQLQNQDPLNPADGTQFVAQLAQFQQLEQSVNMGQDIAAMRNDLDQLLSNAATPATV